MLEATGIVAEYNPFHNGHLYHLREAKRLTGQPVIAVMSASFMQRGEPAFLDKWSRARLAVDCGVDLVLELPAAFTLRSAQYFATGAVQLLAATGCVTHLACGTETPERNYPALARALTAPAAQARLKELLAAGRSYAVATSELLAELSGQATYGTPATSPAAPTCAEPATASGLSKGSSMLALPNDILALEYTKALLNTTITPVFIKRQDPGYNSTEITATMASATAIRTAYAAEALRSQHAAQAMPNPDTSSEDALSEGSSTSWRDAVPPEVRQALETTCAGYDEARLWQLLRYQLRLLSPEEIASRCQCSEGLENLLKQAGNASSLAEALALCTKKRYSTSRIRRLLAQLLLNVPRAYLEEEQPAYLRVLAFNDTGRALLKQMKTTASLPIITKLGKDYASLTTRPQLALELKATDMWSLVQKNPSFDRMGNDFLCSPIYIPK